MNLVQTNLLREVAAEVKAQGGPLQFKSHALKNLELRTVLKESHCSPIVDLVFNALDTQHRNLFASIGKDQVTIYDDEHMGDFLGVVVQYVNSPSAHHRGGDITCCAWIQMSGITRHELGDACLAVSGPEGVIQIISVVEARVTSLLRGHRGEVVELRGCVGVPGLLLSLGADGGVRMWDVATGLCLAEMASDALTLETHPDGSCFFTGHRGGRICRWDLDLDSQPPLSPPSAAGDGRRLALRGTPPTPQQLALPGNPLGDAVDCLRCMPGNRLAAKSSDGKMAVWSLSPESQQEQQQLLLLLSLRVPGTHPAAGPGQGSAAALRSGRCRFSVTQDGAFICVGNAAGDVYVYDTALGTRVAHHSAQKVRGPARAAALSEDGRHLLTVHGNGYILRYEYVRKQLRDRAAAARAARESGDAGQAAPEAQPEGAARGPEVADTGAAASSREVSPEACTEDDASAAVGPGGAAGRPLAAKRPRPADGEASPSSADDGAGGARAAESGGRRLKLRVRIGPQTGGVAVQAGADGVGGGARAGESVGGAVSVSAEERETSPDAEWSGGLEEEEEE